MIVSFIIIILISGGVWVWLLFLYPTTSPLKVVSFYTYHLQHPHATMTKQTVAFMPYWRVVDAHFAQMDLLSEINYFSLAVASDGNFIKVTGNQTDPGWLGWSSTPVKDLIAKTQITGGKFTVTIFTQKNKIIETLLANPKAQQSLIDNTLSEIKSRHLQGVVVDFEYDGHPDDATITAFTAFAKDLSSQLHLYNAQATLSITLPPLAGREKGLFDLTALKNIADRFIGMSYDYYTPSSDIAGPVAPMNGFKDNKFFFDVTTTYEDYLKVLPKEKILMGVPYYGYDWTVTDGKKIQSPTYPPGDPNNYTAILSYARMREDTDLKENQCQWDSIAEEKWCWYTDSKNIDHQVWFDNNQAISAKYDYAKNQNFAGVAIWTLGYDKNYPDLWDIMSKTFKK